ncbi:hypothetical protein WG915_04200 [Corynebacterium sp. H128]|uniref:esterase/lipase family protein n=1 Tax=Corynebacterium sp. H128 TaxID=3133427 RepID=UPI0030948F92
MKTLSSLICAGITAICVAVAPISAHAVPTPFTDDGIPVNGTGPVQSSAPGAAALELVRPGISPEGSNDFSCVPSQGQHPVVLIPGTTGSAYDSFAYFAPRLKQEGLCVYTFNTNPLGFNSQFSFAGDIAESAEVLDLVVDKVLASTGAAQVDLVGWSQGGGRRAVGRCQPTTSLSWAARPRCAAAWELSRATTAPISGSSMIMRCDTRLRANNTTRLEWR